LRRDRPAACCVSTRRCRSIGQPSVVSYEMIGAMTSSPAARPVQGALVRPWRRAAGDAYVAAKTRNSSKPLTLEAAATPASRPVAANATDESGVAGGCRSAKAARPSAPIHEKASKRSGVRPKRPTAISGMTAKISPPTRARDHVAPQARHAHAIHHGTSVAATDVTTCARAALGAPPPPMARVTTPMSPG
jgi:hypothetical protein